MDKKVLDIIDMDELIRSWRKIIEISNYLYALKKEISNTDPSILKPDLNPSDIEHSDYRELLTLDANIHAASLTIDNILRQMRKPEYIGKSKLCLGWSEGGRAYHGNDKLINKPNPENSK